MAAEHQALPPSDAIHQRYQAAQARRQAEAEAEQAEVQAKQERERAAYLAALTHVPEDLRPYLVETTTIPALTHAQRANLFFTIDGFQPIRFGITVVSDHDYAGCDVADCMSEWHYKLSWQPDTGNGVWAYKSANGTWYLASDLDDALHPAPVRTVPAVPRVPVVQSGGIHLPPFNPATGKYQR